MTNKLFYLALATSIAGLVLLTYAADILEPDPVEISKINNNQNDYLYKNVHIQGEIIDFKRFKGGSISLKVNDRTGTITVFLQYHVANKVNVQMGQRIDVIGTVEIYKGDLEIVVNDQKHINVI